MEFEKRKGRKMTEKNKRYGIQVKWHSLQRIGIYNANTFELNDLEYRF